MLAARNNLPTTAQFVRSAVTASRYIHRNPVKRGLVSDPADWPWSSFRHYALRQMGVVEIESEWTARDREAKALAASPPAFLNPRNREAG